ncbi:hypothetical protein O6H91_04G090500 [Diphasiastrum complanatum]|uniref:Uncharacterized protein n=1 Tax=Diphasiastrum complanatum TaxID=34168 RepID=A0ACC2DZ91_DIPCM|nr:hypothetical protein O6H91_04G090500 [Diphasiastrum complanatum]
MSCNGCRVLRKRCSDNCELRSCLQWIDGAEAQGRATTFVAKFFGRANLTNFLTTVDESQRTSLFISLLYEACGRVVNPVHGAIGLLWSGDWQACQAAVEAVFKGEMLHPVTASPPAGSNDSSFLYIPLLELSKYKKEGLSTPTFQLASTGTLVHRTRTKEAKFERDPVRPSLWLGCSDCRREHSEIGMRTMKEKLEIPKPMNDDVCNLLKTTQSKRNGGLHSSKKDLKRKHGETNPQEHVIRPVPQRSSDGIKTFLEAVHGGADPKMEILTESDVVLDLTLSLHSVTTCPHTCDTKMLRGCRQAPTATQ